MEESTERLAARGRRLSSSSQGLHATNKPKQPTLQQQTSGMSPINIRPYLAFSMLTNARDSLYEYRDQTTNSPLKRTQLHDSGPQSCRADQQHRPHQFSPHPQPRPADECLPPRLPPAAGLPPSTISKSVFPCAEKSSTFCKVERVIEVDLTLREDVMVIEIHQQRLHCYLLISLASP